MMTAARQGAVKLLIEGRPGSGKTTVIGRLVDLLREADFPVAGFLTREIRTSGGRREGFRIETLDGGSATLAHTKLAGPPRVGRYGVDLEAFERLALPVIADPGEGVVVIDELGRMELASEPFRDSVSRLFERPAPIVATVHAHRQPFTDALKRRPDVELLRVTTRTRDDLPEQLLKRLGPAVRGSRRAAAGD
jgi:nucleoside-triphosphatase